MRGFNTLQISVLIFGDILTFLIVTVIGFTSHGTVGTAGTRMLTTFFPLLGAWFLVAPLLILFKYPIVSDWRQLWRPVWGMIIAAPLAAWLRGLLISTPILPLFVIILGGVSAVGILVWRALFWLYIRRFKSING
jgi:hypothetical protein